MKTYAVVATRDGSQWLADVPVLQGAHTYARTLEQLDRHVREVIVLVEDLDESEMDDLQVDYVYDIAGSKGRIKDAQDIRQRAAELAALSQAASTELVFALKEEARLSGRDIAAVVGMSHQRVHQIIAEAAPKRAPAKPGKTETLKPARASGAVKGATSSLRVSTGKRTSSASALQGTASKKMASPSRKSKI